jgi:D-amino peptidase
MKIFIMTDMEGCAGVLNFDDYVYPKSRYYDRGLQILTEETNAAIEGFFDGGATEVVVMDGHGAGAIDHLRLDPRASLIRGVLRPPQGPYPFSLDKSFQAIAWVGQHAKAGTNYSHMTHTGTTQFIDVSINGISIGEYGEIALCAMELGVPSILACGEKALCAEAKALTPGVVTVSVKEGLNPDGLDSMTTEEYTYAKLAARHLSHPTACRLIREGAREAARRLAKDPRQFKYPRLTPPYIRTSRVRVEGKAPAYETRDQHPSSLIALLNLPPTVVRKKPTSRKKKR